MKPHNKAEKNEKFQQEFLQNIDSYIYIKHSPASVPGTKNGL